MTLFEKIGPLRVLHTKVFIKVAMHPLVRPILLLFARRSLTPDRWVFVIGCYNSGTTLLASILRQHPEMGGLPNEGAFLTDSLPYPEQKGWPRMWIKCLDYIKSVGTDSEEKRAEKIKCHWSLWYPKDAPNLIEKTISNAVRMPFLQKNFKPAYFIYIVRDGYAVAKGIQRKANYSRWGCSYAEDEGYPIELCAEQWKISDEIVQRDKVGLKHFLEVTYEELTDNPKETFTKITDFLNVSAMPDEVFDAGWDIHEVSSKIKNMNERSHKYLTESDIDAINSVASDLLEKRRYKRDS